MTSAPTDGARPVDPVDPPTGSTPVVEQDAEQQPQTSVARGSLAMASGTIVSRVLGVLRQSLIVSAVGVALAGEAFTAANTLPNVIYMIIAGGVLNSVLIPQLVKAAKNPDGGREFTDRILTVGGTAILVVTIVCTAGAALLMRVMTDFSGRTLELAVFFAFLTLPQIFFYGVYALLGQVLGARGRFLAFGWSPAIANVVAIAGLVSFLVLFPRQVAPDQWTPSMVWWLGGTATASIAVQGIVLLVPLWRSGFRFTPRWGLRGVGLDQASKIARWAFAALAVSQVGFVVASKIMTTASDQQTAANFIPGVTVYSNALLVFQMPHSFVALSFITAMYPRIAAAAHRGDHPALRRDYVAGLTVPTALTLPMSVVLLVFSVPICQLLFHAHVGASALVLATMALGVVPFGVDVLNQRYLYAHDDGRTAFAEQCVLTGSATLVNLAALLFVPVEYVVPVIGGGIVVSNVLSSLFGLWFIRRRIGRLGGMRVVRAWLRIGVASAVAGGVAWLVVLGCQRFLGDSRLDALVPLVAGGAVFAFFYFTVAALLGIKEVGEVVDPMVRTGARLGSSVLRRVRRTA
ncbi:murein biosynthesis integral membrane protein MurJ [Lapillicoccus jejuensis]|uniref:Putative peptidoglycan lipid II flippase n=1 Tax=Lapillicoccus jejuensis TaxID=402171 RepID=A0A542DX39_9MICO|nr:murein biosynthesis integral membrane protein MurJ [Lapillicoccus jejuensis]TQJ07650.1 putative peptidoglycan lipid II flippase [Lapillicoccus jejuensis]